MDRLLSMLMEPIEVDEVVVNDLPIKPPFPDEYRKYLFGMSKLIIPDNYKNIEVLTNTKPKYWKKNYDFDKKLLNLTNKYNLFPVHYLTDYLRGDIILTEELQHFTKKFIASLT